MFTGHCFWCPGSDLGFDMQSFCASRLGCSASLNISCSRSVALTVLSRCERLTPTSFHHETLFIKTFSSSASAPVHPPILGSPYCFAHSESQLRFATPRPRRSASRGCKKLVVEGEVTFAKDVVWGAQCRPASSQIARLVWSFLSAPKRSKGIREVWYGCCSAWAT